MFNRSRRVTATLQIDVDRDSIATFCYAVLGGGMLIEVTKTVKTTEMVEVELPFYYRHDLMLDECYSVIYGKID